eukprot:TRINITY_DN18953_c0_g1_i1.p1 TRINITY_DN18953_c0_g1~~TRINITY_DN18953_c0_g1_i1.p1  ORF type:complete len:305 (-),score=109.72 TRINITY_DN18953_c0_g1_i1:38-922(-)
MESLQLQTGQQYRVKLRPVVIFNVYDHFARRRDEERDAGEQQPSQPPVQRVIGTLLGTISRDGLVEVCDCFPVPHSESKQVAIDMKFHKEMLELHQRVAPSRGVVGWYATGSDITESSAMIHEFYLQEMHGIQPVHLTVDTDLSLEQLQTKAFMGNFVRFSGKKVMTAFLPVPLEMESFNTEQIGLDAVRRSRDGKVPLQSLNTIESSLSNLLALLDTVVGYVEEVKEGKRPEDRAVGRQLQRALHAVPRLSSAGVEKLFADSIQELLMVVYLSSLTRAQVTLAEKIRTVLTIN